MTYANFPLDPADITALKRWLASQKDTVLRPVEIDEILADLRVLASAPRKMTTAGVGDCCARFVAYGDWYLASVLGLVSVYSEVPLDSSLSRSQKCTLRRTCP